MSWTLFRLDGFDHLRAVVNPANGEVVATVDEKVAEGVKSIPDLVQAAVALGEEFRAKFGAATVQGLENFSRFENLIAKIKGSV